MNFTRVRNDRPLIKGHTGPVMDVKFSPFRTNLLATASDDSTVRLWEIPQTGLEDGLVEQQKFTGHSKKVAMINFSPTVAELVATGSFDNTINLWNIYNGQAYSKTVFKDGIYSLDWNANGSLLGTTTKEKLVYVIDPRGEKTQLTCHAHDSGKTQKMAFLDGDYLFTCGFGKTNAREIKLFDTRKFTESVQVVPVDTQSGIMMPHYDRDTGLIYVPGKGEGNIRYFDFSESTIKFANEYRGDNQQKSVSFFPKRCMNFNKCEIARIAKLTKDSIEYVSFFVPKRNEGYDAAVYPDCLAGEPALGVEEWLKGANSDPIRKNITTLENKWSAPEITFEKKVEVHEEKEVTIF
jgi:WD40 repeat protein